MSGNSNKINLQNSDKPPTNIYSNNMNNTNLTRNIGAINPKAKRYKGQGI